MAKGIRELLISREPKSPTAPNMAPAVMSHSSQGPPMTRAMWVKDPASHEDQPPAAMAAVIGRM